MKEFDYERLVKKWDRWEQMKLEPRTIYGLIDPRDGKFHYIGATVNLEKRITAHLGKSSYNSGLNEWINDLVQAGLTPQVETLEVAENSYVSSEVENRWIRKLYVEGHPLKNRMGLYWHDGRVDSNVEKLLERQRIIQEYIRTGEIT